MTRTFHCSARLLVATALAVGLAGCGKNPTGAGGSAAAQANADDAAQQVGASMAQDNGGMVSTNGASPASLDGVAARKVGLAQPASAMSETTFTVGAITFTFSRVYLNATHNGMAYFDPVVTWGIALTSRATGSISTSQFNASIGRTGTLDLWNVSVLAPDTVLMNGTAHDTAQCSFVSATTGAQRYFHTEMSGAMTDVRVPKPVTSNYPASGTVTWTVSADRLRSNDRADLEEHYTAIVVVTFNGTRYPDVTVNGTYRYHLDIKTGAISRA